MNKKAKRKAFFICMAICLMNLSLAIKITERFNIKRVSNDRIHYSNELNVVVSKGHMEKQENKINEGLTEDKKEPFVLESNIKVAFKNKENDIEPLFFITVPVLCNMIKNRLIEENMLIPSSNKTWKKPMEILLDKDLEGIKNLSKAISREDIVRFLKNEDIKFKDDLSTEELLTGKGYVIEKERLIQLFEKYVDERWDELFPIMMDGLAIVKTEKGFQFTNPKKIASNENKLAKKETEWLMPDVRNLSMRNAIELLNKKTAKIKAFGHGFVVDQTPKPNEVVKGDGECILYGRLSN